MQPAQLTISFYNTTNLDEKELAVQSQRAIRQEWKVWEILNAVGTHLTPYEIWKLYEKKYGKCYKGSIGRALTRGTKAGIFLKVNVMKKGDWHIQNHQWKSLPVGSRENVKFK